MAVSVSVVDTVQNGSSTTSTSFSFASGSYDAGDLIIIVFVKDDDVEPTMPSGFTNLLSFGSNNAMWITVAYKEAVTADETATGYTITHDLEQTVGVLYRCTGANTTPTAHSDSTDIADATSITLAAATANDADSVIFTGMGHDDGRNITNGRFIDSTVTTEDFNGRSSGAANDANGCGLVCGHWSPGSTSIPSLTHGGLSTTNELAAYLIEVEESAAAGVTADAAFTLADATVSSDGDIEVQADGAFTLADATVSSDGDIEVQADAAFTLADATVAADGDIDVQADGAFTLADATVAADGDIEVQADAAFTLADATLDSAGTAIGGDIIADANITLEDATLSADGEVTTTAVQADAAFTLADATLDSAGAVDVLADSAITLDDFLLSAAAAVDIQGAAAFTLADCSVSSYAAESIPLDPLETVIALRDETTAAARINQTTSDSLVDVRTVSARV